ncbi:MAG: TnsD family Tn7-like transposition protein, partial [Halothece sp. Uz-M2-17]|nr:TnsD family Tn7-like transposition protein [Halothece sp. Uz-M2-17]
MNKDTTFEGETSTVLSFFPLPYPDELFYSLVARYQIRTGDTSPKGIQQELFSSSTVIAIADLPSHLNALSSNLPPLFGWTAERFLQNHTLFPYYQPFLSRDRAHRIQASMKADNGGNIHTRAGIMASSVKTPQFLRFCPDCLQDDFSQYGESYWHRLHQVPGVLFCPTHAQPLQNSLIPVNGMNRHEYFPANSENCPISSVSSSYSAITVEKLIGIAQKAAWLLKQNLSSRELPWFRQKYLTLLIEKGLATASGRVHQKKLHDAFLFDYGREMLALIDSSMNYPNGS